MCRFCLPRCYSRSREGTETAIASFDEVKEFSLRGQQDVIGARDELINRLEGEYEKHFITLEPHITYLSVKETDFAALQEQAVEAMEPARSASAEGWLNTTVLVTSEVRARPVRRERGMTLLVPSIIRSVRTIVRQRRDDRSACHGRVRGSKPRNMRSMT